MNKKKIAFAMCASFCSLRKALDEAKKLSKIYDLIPIMSFNSSKIDTRFGKAKEIKSEFESICNKKVITTIEEAEPIGPKNMCDLLIVCPCTSNTLGKICNAITDTPVTMSVKSQLRVQKPVVISFASNDALGFSLQNIAKGINSKNIYFTPMIQDDPTSKPNSLVADFSLVPKTIEYALNQKQIYPIITMDKT